MIAKVVFKDGNLHYHNFGIGDTLQVCPKSDDTIWLYSSLFNGDEVAEVLYDKSHVDHIMMYLPGMTEGEIIYPEVQQLEGILDVGEPAKIGGTD